MTGWACLFAPSLVLIAWALTWALGWDSDAAVIVFLLLVAAASVIAELERRRLREAIRRGR